jgi:predicted RNA-binding Zn ribbon-like protein
VLAQTWGPEDETKPAPMPLLLLQAFVNTWEGDSGVDQLANPVAGPPRWLQDSGLLRGAGADLAQVRVVRESIRALIVANTEHAGVDPGALRALRRLADDASLDLILSEDGTVDLRPTGEGSAALAASLLLIMRDAQHDGSWARLKACRNPDCLWAFYDRSHAGRGAWCDMALCGNRIKNRNLRTRRSNGAAPDTVA